VWLVHEKIKWGEVDFKYFHDFSHWGTEANAFTKMLDALYENCRTVVVIQETKILEPGHVTAFCSSCFPFDGDVSKLLTVLCQAHILIFFNCDGNITGIHTTYERLIHSKLLFI
jgi:hypothetical protein